MAEEDNLSIFPDVEDVPEDVVSDASGAIARAWDRFQRLIGEKDPSADYFQRYEVVAPKNKLVRLDAAIMALHLMTAKTSFRSVPASVRAELEKIKELVENFVAKQLIQRGLTQSATFVFQTLLQILGALFKIQETEDRAKRMESRIRNASRVAREELIAIALPQVKCSRPTGYVLTRHPKARQRRPNGSWKDCG